MEVDIQRKSDVILCNCCIYGFYVPNKICFKSSSKNVQMGTRIGVDGAEVKLNCELCCCVVAEFFNFNGRPIDLLHGGRGCFKAPGLLCSEQEEI